MNLMVDTRVWSLALRRSPPSDAAVYAKGPYAFHMLRETFGDEKFFGFLRQLAAALSGREAVTRDIQQVAERAFGGVGQDGQSYNVDLEWFFDQWIRGIGIPELRMTVENRQTEDGAYLVDGKIRQLFCAGRHDSPPSLAARIPTTCTGSRGCSSTSRTST